MDFFEAQARAKQRSGRLVALFILAILGTILAAYVAGLMLLRYSAQEYGNMVSDGIWHPKLFFGITGGTLLVVGCASLFKWQQYSAGGSAVAENLGGRRVDPRTTDLNEKRLLNVVEEMAIASGTPVPAVYIMDDEPGINAFAAGLTTSDAVVAVTRGTLEKLNRDELQGVVGHEFSHILNGDMRLNMRLSAMVFGILVLGLLGRIILSSLRHTRVPRSRDEKNSGGVAIFIIAVGFTLLVIGYVGYFFGRLIQAAVSRQREFLADASAVQFTRNPTSIAGALKKIGGYALGSSLQSAKSAEIGHFFFAQGFRSSFGGLWATHPPLAERIRAIDTSFDGKYFEPPQVVDVALESFITAGFAKPQGTGSVAARGHAANPLPPALATAAVAAIGTLTPAQLANAHTLLESVSADLRDAAHDPNAAPILLYGLLLATEPALRTTGRQIVANRVGPDAAALLDQLDPALAAVTPEQRLPILQLALPVLRQLTPGALDTFIETLDELVHADGQMSTFEFALQKLVIHTLDLRREPGRAITQYHSFNAVGDEISIVLSALAHAATSDAAFAPQAFAAGASHLKLVEARLQFLSREAASFAKLDRALDKLAAASLPIKQRTLLAAAQVVGADGRILITEAELLRAVAAALDCPMPPLA